MTYEFEVVSRCTRNGIVAWSHVARQLGISEERAKALHGFIHPTKADEDAESERLAVRRR